MRVDRTLLAFLRINRTQFVIKAKREVFGKITVFKIGSSKTNEKGKWAYYKDGESFVRVPHNTSFIFSTGQYSKAIKSGLSVDGKPH